MLKSDVQMSCSTVGNQQMIKRRSVTRLCVMQETCFIESQISMVDQATWCLSAGMVMDRFVTLTLQCIRSLTQTSSGQLVRLTLHSGMVTSMLSTEFVI